MVIYMCITLTFLFKLARLLLEIIIIDGLEVLESRGVKYREESEFEVISLRMITW